MDTSKKRIAILIAVIVLGGLAYSLAGGDLFKGLISRISGVRPVELERPEPYAYLQDPEDIPTIHSLTETDFELSDNHDYEGVKLQAKEGYADFIVLRADFDREEAEDGSFIFTDKSEAINTEITSRCLSVQPVSLPNVEAFSRFDRDNIDLRNLDLINVDDLDLRNAELLNFRNINLQNDNSLCFEPGENTLTLSGEDIPKMVHQMKLIVKDAEERFDDKVKTFGLQIEPGLGILPEVEPTLEIACSVELQEDGHTVNLNNESVYLPVDDPNWRWAWSLGYDDENGDPAFETAPDESGDVVKVYPIPTAEEGDQTYKIALHGSYPGKDIEGDAPCGEVTIEAPDAPEAPAPGEPVITPDFDFGEGSGNATGIAYGNISNLTTIEGGELTKVKWEFAANTQNPASTTIFEGAQLEDLNPVDGIVGDIYHQFFYPIDPAISDVSNEPVTIDVTLTAYSGDFSESITKTITIQNTLIADFTCRKTDNRWTFTDASSDPLSGLQNNAPKPESQVFINFSDNSLDISSPVSTLNSVPHVINNVDQVFKYKITRPQSNSSTISAKLADKCPEAFVAAPAAIPVVNSDFELELSSTDAIQVSYKLLNKGTVQNGMITSVSWSFPDDPAMAAGFVNTINVGDLKFVDTNEDNIKGDSFHNFKYPSGNGSEPVSRTITFKVCSGQVCDESQKTIEIKNPLIADFTCRHTGAADANTWNFMDNSMESVGGALVPQPPAPESQISITFTDGSPTPINKTKATLGLSPQPNIPPSPIVVKDPHADFKYKITNPDGNSDEITSSLAKKCPDGVANYEAALADAQPLGGEAEEFDFSGFDFSGSFENFEAIEVMGPPTGGGRSSGANMPSYSGNAGIGINEDLLNAALNSTLHINLFTDVMVAGEAPWDEEVIAKPGSKVYVKATCKSGEGVIKISPINGEGYEDMVLDVLENESTCKDEVIVPPAPKQCSDDLDNDTDTKIDFPLDPGCASAEDDDETDAVVVVPPAPKQCADGLDNDTDGKIDHPLDPGCDNPEDDNETDASIVVVPGPSGPQPQCSNGIDDDEDGYSDFGVDPGCDAPSDNNEYNPIAKTFAQCADGIDNDGDGFTDVGKDPGCDDAGDNSEINKQEPVNEGTAKLPSCLEYVSPKSFEDLDDVSEDLEDIITKQSSTAYDGEYDNFEGKAIFVGYSKDNLRYFKGDQSIRRDEAVKILEIATCYPDYLIKKNKMTEKKVNYNDKEFKNDAYWASNYIYLAAHGEVVDKTKKKFNPGSNVSRAEFIKMMITMYYQSTGKTIKEYKSAKSPFVDVDKDDWFYKYAMAAYDLDIAKGFKDKNGKLRLDPNVILTRAQAAVLIHNYFVALDVEGYEDEEAKILKD